MILIRKPGIGVEVEFTFTGTAMLRQRWKNCGHQHLFWHPSLLKRTVLGGVRVRVTVNFVYRRTRTRYPQFLNWSKFKRKRSEMDIKNSTGEKMPSSQHESLDWLCMAQGRTEGGMVKFYFHSTRSFQPPSIMGYYFSSQELVTVSFLIISLSKFQLLYY